MRKHYWVIKKTKVHIFVFWNCPQNDKEVKLLHFLDEEGLEHRQCELNLSLWFATLHPKSGTKQPDYKSSGMLLAYFVIIGYQQNWKKIFREQLQEQWYVMGHIMLGN